MHFMNKHHKESFSYYFIFDRIICVLVTFWERGHFVMLIINSLHLLTCISGHGGEFETGTSRFQIKRPEPLGHAAAVVRFVNG